jgi:Spy/CpxP family protein refolding chaperone
MKASMAVRLGLAIAGLVITGSALAMAQGGEMGSRPGFGEHRPPFERALGPQGDHGRWWNNPNIVEKLKLTAEQRKAMDDTLFQHREKLIDLRGSVEKAELELQPLMRDDKPDEGRILAQIDKVAQARAELEKANARFLLAIRSKLTPEQWTAVQAFRANHEQERGGWGKDGRGRDDRGPNEPNRRRMPPPPAPQGAGPQGPGPQGMMDEGPGAGEPGAPQAGAGAEQ